MSYVISFNDETEKFVMDGYEENFISSHLWAIAIKEGLESAFVSTISESHALSMLLDSGVEIELVDIDW